MSNHPFRFSLWLLALVVAVVFWFFLPSNNVTQSSPSAQNASLQTVSQVPAAQSQTEIQPQAEQRQRVQAFILKSEQMVSAYSQGGFRELERHSRHLFLTDCQSYLHSLGLMQADATIIAELVYLKNLELMSVADAGLLKPHESRDSMNTAMRAAREMDEALSSFVGIERATKIKTWNESRLDRKRAQDFRLHLESQLMSLSNAQEQAISMALYEERIARTAFDISLSTIAHENKTRYIRDVTRRTAAILDSLQKRELELFLEKMARAKQPLR